MAGPMSERRRRKYRREQLILLLKQAARRVIMQVREERAKHGKGAWSGMTDLFQVALTEFEYLGFRCTAVLQCYS